MKRQWVIRFVLCVMALLCIATAVGYQLYEATNFRQTEFNRSASALGLEKVPGTGLQRATQRKVQDPSDQTEEIADEREDTVHIALFGLDRRSPVGNARSDAIIVLTIDFVHDKLKVTSLMRDLEVSVEGYGRTKLTHAYAYGGPQLAVKTINQNFGMNIRDYVAVDFFTMEKLVDAVGGVEIEIEDDEIPVMNQYIRETSRLQGVSPTEISEGGEQRLSGLQAVAYSRIRYVGNGDYERTERQRKIALLLLEDVRRRGVTSVVSVLAEVAPHIETSLDRAGIVNLAYQFHREGISAIEQQRFPVDGTWESVFNRSGEWVLRVDPEMLLKSAQDYFYFDRQPEA